MNMIRKAAASKTGQVETVVEREDGDFEIVRTIIVLKFAVGPRGCAADLRATSNRIASGTCC